MLSSTPPTKGVVSCIMRFASYKKNSRGDCGLNGGKGRCT